jgi:hypothetical protein
MNQKMRTKTLKSKYLLQTATVRGYRIARVSIILPKILALILATPQQLPIPAHLHLPAIPAVRNAVGGVLSKTTLAMVTQQATAHHRQKAKARHLKAYREGILVAGDYSYGQLEQLWINAGGSTALAPLMAAIALAESSGDPRAYNPSGATGLWQILGAVNPADQDNLTNPEVNAHEAVLKYQEQGLGAWVTYTSGAYEQYYQGNVPPSSLPQGGSSGSSGSGKGTTTTSSTSGGNGYSIWNGVWGGVEGILHGFQPSAIAGGIENPPANPLTSLNDMAGTFKAGVDDIEQALKWVSWLFAPSNWVRVGGFVIGLLAFGASMYMFKEAI